ncbi:MAG: aminotransferase class I/II-fold pyridoxal phosphate-dependent enzyme [Candidatus Symbiobacter sp.]|nr:aminotransferase class I/II-fold pyridoxal phosphate-dependent enzyme [Candidatus Symbiobacter sp.]
MLNNRIKNFDDYPFRRLARLLDGIAPPMTLSPVSMAVGEPQLGMPDLAVTAMMAARAGWGKYAQNGGTPELRAAIAAWINRRYDLPTGFFTAEKHLMPVPGSRAGLFMAALACVPEAKPDTNHKPVVMMPNPFYQVYYGAAILAGAEPVLVAADAKNQFLPDFVGLPDEIWARCAMIYLCSPANPQGNVASPAYLKQLLTKARQWQATLVLDECYSEVYDHTPPVGGLTIAYQNGENLKNLVVFNSLSKRSSAPGLRSGYAAGDADVMAALGRVLDYGGTPLPLPVQAASVALWHDEAHVTAMRAHYRENFARAQAILGNRFGMYRPDGGFFLWLSVGNGEQAAQKLWREAHLRVVPGAYFAGNSWQPGGNGKNPGQEFIRVALVHAANVTEQGLRRLVDVLG